MSTAFLRRLIARPVLPEVCCSAFKFLAPIDRAKNFNNSG
jgi:hypothetical protein